MAKIDVFSKITAFAIGKNSVENQIPSVQTPPSTQYHIHRHHRNTSTVSQNDTILTTQPSTQSIACNSISDQSYSSVIQESTTNSSNPINNGTEIYHPSRQQQQQQTPSTSTSTTSESMNMELSSSILSNNNNSITSPSPNNNQWRHKLTNLKQSFQNVGTPRFHRRPKVLCKLIFFKFNSFDFYFVYK